MIKIERDEYTGKDGKNYFAYKINTQVKGRDVIIDMIPKDSGGYIVLDIIFDVATDGVNLFMSKEKMIDEKTGKEILYTLYKAVCIDNEGQEISIDMKPKRNSDKTLLSILAIDVLKETK